MNEEKSTLSIDRNMVEPLELQELPNQNIYIYTAPKTSAVLYQTLKTGTHNRVTIDVNEGSKIELFTYNTGSNDEIYESELEVNIQENGEFTLYNLTSRQSSSNTIQKVNLKGSRSTALLNNFIIGINGIHVNNDALINHFTGDTTSKIENYCVAKDSSRIYCNNDTAISHGSKGSNAYQKTKGLSVGSDAIIRVSPILHIDEYDVLAGHGASIGSLSKEDLFYLMSRGLTKAQAEKLAIFGMVKPLIDQIKIERFGNLIRQDLEEKFK
jgi:Fe-S cluster assembly protein SufD